MSKQSGRGLIGGADSQKRDQRLRGEVARLLRKRKKRDARALVKPVGEPPEQKLPQQIFEILSLLDGGAKPITNSAVAKTVRDGVEVPEVIPGKVVRFRRGRGKIEFHRKHFEIAKKYRKTRTELRLAEISKKLGLNREEAIAFLQANGWQNLPKRKA
jgi:hypothetical protein